MAILQKRAITRCNRLGKPIILTRIVDTMVNVREISQNMLMEHSVVHRSTFSGRSLSSAHALLPPGSAGHADSANQPAQP